MWRLLIAIFITCVTVSIAFPADPCRGLPLCRRTGEKNFANGRVTRRPATRPRFRPSLAKTTVEEEPVETKSDIDDSGEKISVVDAVSVPNTERKSPIRRPKPIRRQPARENSNSDACAGLRFCKLSGSSSSSFSSRRKPLRKAATPAPAPIIPAANPASQSLLTAVLRGNIDEALLMVDEGADVNAEDVHGNSVLLIAAQNGREGVVKSLILNGANVNHGNNHQNTAIHLAAQNGWTGIAKILLSAKRIEMNFADLHANTALHLAAQNGQEGVLEELIKAGADVNRKNAHGLVPLHLAAQNGHYTISEMLARAGTELDSVDLIGNTPLHTAYHTSHDKIAKMLESYGANAKKRNLSGLIPSQLRG